MTNISENVEPWAGPTGIKPLDSGSVNREVNAIKHPPRPPIAARHKRGATARSAMSSAELEMLGTNFTEEHVDYLSVRGITKEVAAQIYKVDGSDLVIPYRDLNGQIYPILSEDEIVDGGAYIVRRVFPTTIPKFRSPPKAGNRPYFSPLAPRGVFEQIDIPLVITEGPIKADACFAAIPKDFAFVALSGTWNWLDKRGDDGIWRNSNDERELIPELKALPMAGRQVIVMFDSDISANRNVYQAAKSLLAWCQQRGAKIYQVLLPTEPDGSKNGADDYLRRYGAENLIALISNPEPVGWPLPAPLLDKNGELRRDYTPAELKWLFKEAGAISDIEARDMLIRALPSRTGWKYVDLLHKIDSGSEQGSGADSLFIRDDFYNESLSLDSRWIVPGMVPRGEAIVLTADPGVGKSLLAYLLMYCVATGSPFLGHPIAKGRVLIIQLEEGPTSFQARTEALGFDKLPKGVNGDWDASLSFDLAIPSHVETLRSMLRNYDVCMVDSARAAGRSFSVDENHADFGRIVIRPLVKKLFNGADCAGIIIHHNAKGSGKAAGTQDISAAVWGVFNLTIVPGAEKGANGVPNELYLTSDKVRDGDPIKWHLRRDRTDGADGSGNGWNYTLLDELQYMAPDLGLRERFALVLMSAEEPLTLREISSRLGIPPAIDGRVSATLRSQASRDTAIRRWRITEKAADGSSLYFMPLDMRGADGGGMSHSAECNQPPSPPAAEIINHATTLSYQGDSGLRSLLSSTSVNPKPDEAVLGDVEPVLHNLVVTQPPITLSTTGGLRTSPKTEGGEGGTPLLPQARSAFAVPNDGLRTNCCRGQRSRPLTKRRNNTSPTHKLEIADEGALGLPIPAGPLIDPSSDSPLVIDLETKSASLLWTPSTEESPFVRLVGSDYGIATDPSLLTEHRGCFVAHNGFGFDFVALARHYCWDLLDLGDACRLIDTMVLAMLREKRMHSPDPDKTVSGIGINYKQNWALDPLAERITGTGKTDNLDELAVAAARASGLTGTVMELKAEGYSLIPRNLPAYSAYLKGDVEATRAVFNHYGELSEYEQREMRLMTRLVNGITVAGLRIDVELLERRIAEREAELNSLRVKLTSKYSLTGFRKDGKPAAKLCGTEAGKTAIEKAAIEIGLKLPRSKKTNQISLAKDGLLELLEIAQQEQKQDQVDLLEIVMAENGQTHIYGSVKSHLHADGRVHPTIAPAQASGRFSITNPGMTIFGKRGFDLVAQREIVLPDTDEHVLFACDLAQIDMRAMAVHSQDKQYMRLFLPGLNPETGKPYDAHQGIADAVQLTREMAKKIGHGWNYGMGLDRIIANGVDRALASKFLDGMQRRFPKLVAWKKGDLLQRAQSGLPLDNGFGRQMQCDKRRAFTQAPALMGQGTARDLLAECILNLPIDIVRMLRLQIHDELLFSLPRDRAQEIADQISETMTFQWAPRPDMEKIWIMCSASGFGRNWAECYTGSETMLLVDDAGKKFKYTKLPK